jgi:FtsH-binding integral membrane protein
MANWNEPRPDRTGFDVSPGLARAGVAPATFDAGLRRHMLSIYNYMASGVLLSGVVALLMFTTGTAQAMFFSPLRWLVALSPIAIVFAMSFGANRMQSGTLKALFWAFTVLMGMSLSTIFLVYTGPSIAATFFATAGAFAGLSLYGYTTQRELSGFGTFLIMGVVGLLIATVINMFLQSPGLYYAVGFLGVLIFAGLTAYDTQKLKRMYYAVPREFAGKAVVLGALNLYLDFINMFMFLLRFMGSSRN